MVRFAKPVSRAIAWLVIGWMVAVLALAVLVPRAGGGTPYVILTGSMRPGMPPGTLVVTKPVAAEHVGLGSVITYQLASGRPEVVTHRVVSQGISAVGEPVFRTRGDANTAVDPGWVRPVQIRGERWYDVPYLGYVTTRVGAHTREVVQGFVVAGLLGYAALMLTSSVRARVRSR